MVFTGRAVPDVFPEARSRDHAHPEKRQGGAPTGNRVPVRLFRLRRRPPAHEQRGRRPSRFPRTTTLLVRRWDAGTPSASPVSQKAGAPGNRVSGSVRDSGRT